VVQIPDVIRYATTRLMWGQAIGAAIGAAVGLTISLAFAHGRRQGTVAVPPPPEP
jgi:hypothetical protein